MLKSDSRKAVEVAFKGHGRLLRPWCNSTVEIIRLTEQAGRSTCLEKGGFSLTEMSLITL